MSINRRQFLFKSSAMLAAGSVLSGLGSPREAFAYVPQTLEAPLPARVPILVVVELHGANDILNTHIPYAVPGVSSHYYAARPNLAVKSVTCQRPYSPPPPGNYLPPALDLDGQYGLHGNLSWLANRWHSHGDVAIVQGIGEDVVQELSTSPPWATDGRPRSRATSSRPAGSGGTTISGTRGKRSPRSPSRT